MVIGTQEDTNHGTVVPRPITKYGETDRRKSEYLDSRESGNSDCVWGALLVATLQSGNFAIG